MLFVLNKWVKMQCYCQIQAKYYTLVPLYPCLVLFNILGSQHVLKQNIRSLRVFKWLQTCSAFITYQVSLFVTCATRILIAFCS